MQAETLVALIWMAKASGLFIFALAVVGAIAHQIFGDADPVGQILRVKHVPFLVTGVLTPKGLSVMGSDQDDCVVMPYTSAMKRVFGGTTFRSFYVQVA